MYVQDDFQLTVLIFAKPVFFRWCWPFLAKMKKNRFSNCLTCFQNTRIISILQKILRALKRFMNFKKLKFIGCMHIVHVYKMDMYELCRLAWFEVGLHLDCSNSVLF